MQHHSDDRVLSRRGAREVSETELQSIHGGFNTLVCTVSVTNPSIRDGDACH